MGRGFEPHGAHQKVATQTGDITGLRPRLSGPPLVAGRYRLHTMVEERLVGDTLQRVIDAHVQLVAVSGQCKTVVQVGACQFVLHVTGFNLGFEEREPSADAILLRLEQIEQHPADWAKHGKRAAFIKNALMARLGVALCVAFPLGESVSTRMTMRLAREADIPIHDGSAGSR